MLHELPFVTRVPVLFVVLSLAGCAQGGGLPRDAGRFGIDAGARIDAGLLASDAGVDGATPEDAGVLDAGTLDAGVLDAGMIDAGVLDAGVLDAGMIDAGMIDAGMIDGGMLDAGTRDAGTDAGMRDSGPIDRCLGVSCTGLDTACRVGVCNPATGACSAQPRTDGTTCSDGNACTTGDACSAGTCVAGPPVDCRSLDGTCVRGTCNPTTGTCSATNVTDGTSCDPDASDCVAQTCRAGTCSAAPANDCSACSSGGSVCSAGACGTAPLSLAYGFETGLPAGWTGSGDAPWVVDTSRAFEGTFAAHSGVIGANRTSGLVARFTVSRSSLVSFRFNASTEVTHDTLSVFVDGIEQDPLWSGTWPWTPAAVVIPSGTHTVEWRYTKDGSVDSGADRVWIDDVRLEHLVPLADFESGTLPRSFSTSTADGWTVDTTSARGGSYGAHSADIDDDESSTMERWIRLDAPATFSFAYRVSSERNYDWLEIWIDGTRRDRWSGEVAWTTASYSLGAGSHYLEWRYVKDSSASSGSDRAWIDDVSTGETAGSGAICGG